MKKFQLTIKTPEQDVFSGEVTGIRLAAEGGMIKALANHASLTATLIFSPVVVEIEGKTQEYLARQGVFFFNNEENSATLLALYCEQTEEVDQQMAKDYLEFIEEQIAKGKDLSDFQLVYLEGEKIAVSKQLEN